MSKSLIVICSQYPPRSSPESNHAMFLCENIAEVGGEVTLVTSKLLPEAPLPKGYRIVDALTTWGWKEFFKLAWLIRKTNPDCCLLVYVGWIYNNHPMVTFLPSITRLFCPRTKFITQFENTLGAVVEGRRAKLFWRMTRSLIAPFSHASYKYGTLLSCSDGVIALAESHLNALRRDVTNNQICVKLIPAPPLLQLANNENGKAKLAGRRRLGVIDENVKVVSFFGYVYPGKGVETLLRSLPYVIENVGHQNIRLVFIGKVVDENLWQELLKLQHELDIGQQIVWMGYQQGDSASELLWATDVAVLPFDEGLKANNSSFAGCAYHNLPIVSTRCDGLESIFQDGVNVKLAEAKNPEDLAKCICQVLMSFELSKAISEGAKQLADSEMSWRKTVYETMGLIDAITVRK